MLHPRARTMLLLSLPAVAIGIASSLILIVVMKIASVLQNLLWLRLPGTLGIAQGFTFLDHRHINANRYCGGVGYPFQPGACWTRPPPVNR